MFVLGYIQQKLFSEFHSTLQDLHRDAFGLQSGGGSSTLAGGGVRVGGATGTAGGGGFLGLGPHHTRSTNFWKTFDSDDEDEVEMDTSMQTM